MKRYLTLIGFLVCLSSACASTRGQAAPAAAGAEGQPIKAPPAVVKAAAAKGEPDPNQVICTFERETGSNIPEKICRTRWQIEQERRQAADYVDHPNSNSSGGRGN